MHGPVGGIANQCDALSRRERGDHEASGAHRTLPVTIALGLDDLPRHTGQHRTREQEREGRVRRVEADAQRVAVDERQAGNRRVVVDGAPRVLRALGQRVESFDLAREHGDPGRTHLRIEHAPNGVGKVGRRELARLAAESGMRGEVDAPSDPHVDRAEVCGNFGKRRGRAGHDRRRTGNRVEHKQRVVDPGHHREGLAVVGAGRVERFRDQRHADPQHARRAFRTGGGRRDGGRKRNRQCHCTGKPLDRLVLRHGAVRRVLREQSTPARRPLRCPLGRAMLSKKRVPAHERRMPGTRGTASASPPWPGTAAAAAPSSPARTRTRGGSASAR